MPVDLHLNTRLDPLGTGPIEPSAAAVGSQVFYPAALIFSLSSNAGATIAQPSYGAAGSIFPEGYGDGYVDQSAIWNPFVGRFIWAMIRKPADGSKLPIRVAFTSKDLLASSGARSWIYFDITPAQVGLPEMTFDYPQLTLGASRLYLTAQIGNAAGQVVGAAIFRFSMGELERLAPGVIHFDFFVDRDVANFGGAHRSGTRKYWAAHKGTDRLRGYMWDESSSGIIVQDVPIPTWKRGQSSRTPDGSDWLSSEWGRITGATIGLTPVFGWTAGADKPDRPHAFIYLAQLEQVGNSLKLKGVRYIWNRKLAWAVPALGSNQLGELGMTCAFGGPDDFVGTTVGFVGLPISAASLYDNVTTAQGARGAPRWGDFMSIRNHAEHEARFISTGYTLEADPTDSTRTESRPRYTIFSSGQG